MTKTSNGLPLTIPLEIPAYWTPEQAFAVVELLDDLRDRIWAHYSAQLFDQPTPLGCPTAGLLPRSLDCSEIKVWL
jgi:hypothetical protein